MCNSLPSAATPSEWRWECVTDDLLDGLPPDALRTVEQLAKELAERQSMVFLDDPAFTGDPPGLRTIQRDAGGVGWACTFVVVLVLVPWRLTL
jgi:hypothetical protein